MDVEILVQFSSASTLIDVKFEKRQRRFEFPNGFALLLPPSFLGLVLV
jgi:hypothetical protein